MNLPIPIPDRTPEIHIPTVDTVTTVWYKASKRPESEDDT